jgi:hypothetical protein
MKVLKVQCSCGCHRGIVYVDTVNGPYGILFCPKCDYAEGDAGPCVQTYDVDPRP